jgi:hypothetical protein
MEGPDDLSPGDVYPSSRSLTLSNHMLTEEEKIPYGILIHRASLLLYSRDTLNNVSQVELLLAR